MYGTKNTKKSNATVAETSPIVEGNIDILNWLTKAVLENEDVQDNSFPTKTEPVDFDLLQYVQASGNSNDETLDEKLINSLMSFETQQFVDFPSDYLTDCPAIRNDNADLLERAVDCPASPFCKSEEIVDYIDNSTNSISGSPVCEEEPDWLSTWDCL